MRFGALAPAGAGSGMMARRPRPWHNGRCPIKLKKKWRGEFMEDFLSRERIVAKPGFNRWLVPPAALCIHLCIGMAYGFSVFWKPLQAALLGADGKALPECSAGAVTFGEKSAGTLKALFATNCNWSQFDLGWMFTFFFVLLGVSAAIWGGWLERVGPRKAGLVSALCWC